MADFHSTTVHSDHHDPANVTNPEHAEHHIVTPLQQDLYRVLQL